MYEADPVSQEAQSSKHVEKQALVLLGHSIIFNHGTNCEDTRAIHPQLQVQ
jgi:hypothetical protein